MALPGKILSTLGIMAITLAPATAQYKLVWADEFNRDGGLDEKDWTFERGFVRNNELQWYQPENARRANGMRAALSTACVTASCGSAPR